MDAPTLQAVARHLESIGQHQAAAQVVAMLADALPPVQLPPAPAPQPAQELPSEPAPAPEPQTPAQRPQPRRRQQGHRFTAHQLRCALFGAFRSIYGQSLKGDAALERRTVCLRAWWGVTSTKQFTEAHANGPRGVLWMRALARDPIELHHAIEAAIRSALADEVSDAG